MLCFLVPDDNNLFPRFPGWAQRSQDEYLCVLMQLFSETQSLVRTTDAYRGEAFYPFGFALLIMMAPPGLCLGIWGCRSVEDAAGGEYDYVLRVPV